MAGRREAALVVVGALVGVAVLASPAAAQDELPQPTPGVQSISTPDGDTFVYLPVDGGRRWFPFCPVGEPPDTATDVCGGTGAGDKVYSGRTFLPDPSDARCTVVVAHNDTVRPSDVVLPRKCYRLPLLFGVASAAMLDGIAETLRESVGSCVGQPGSGEQCTNPLTRWPRKDRTGPVDCAAIAARDLPPEVAAYADSGRDQGRMHDVCAVLDAYLATPPATPPPTPAALALGNVAFDLYARGSGSAPTQRVLDLGLFTVNLTEACANGNTVACGLDKAGAAVDCASDPMACLSRWLATGATSAVRLLGEVIAAPPPVDLTDPAFRNVYQPLGITSAYVALLLLLISGIVSAVRLDYAGIGHAVIGVFRYALGLAVLLTLTATALDLAHTISVGIAGDEASLQALTTRFQQAMQFSLAGEGGAAPSAFVAVLALLVLLAAAFTWLVMNGRKAGILIICAFSPILLAGQAGPQWARAWAPRAVKMLAAIIFAQPVAAVFYRLGVGLMSLSPGPGNVVTGLIILLLIGFSPWLLLAFIGITTQMLANEQTRARGGHGGGFSGAAMAAATMRANAPARAALPSTIAHGSAAPASTTAGGGGRTAATALVVAAAAQQVGAHIGEQVTTAGGATGEAPRAPQLAHAATVGAHRRGGSSATLDSPAPPPSNPSPPSPATAASAESPTSAALPSPPTLGQAERADSDTGWAAPR
jgi:hypothetical protein